MMKMMMMMTMIEVVPPSSFSHDERLVAPGGSSHPLLLLLTIIVPSSSSRSLASTSSSQTPILLFSSLGMAEEAINCSSSSTPYCKSWYHPIYITPNGRSNNHGPIFLLWEPPALDSRQLLPVSAHHCIVRPQHRHHYHHHYFNYYRNNHHDHQKHYRIEKPSNVAYSKAPTHPCPSSLSSPFSPTS